MGYVGMCITWCKRYASKSNALWKPLPMSVRYISQGQALKRKEREQYVSRYLLSGIDLEISCLPLAYFPLLLALLILNFATKKIIVLLKNNRFFLVRNSQIWLFSRSFDRVWPKMLLGLFPSTSINVYVFCHWFLVFSP